MSHVKYAVPLEVGDVDSRRTVTNGVRLQEHASALAQELDGKGVFDGPVNAVRARSLAIVAALEREDASAKDRREGAARRNRQATIHPTAVTPQRADVGAAAQATGAHRHKGRSAHPFLSGERDFLAELERVTTGGGVIDGGGGPARDTRAKSTATASSPARASHTSATAPSIPQPSPPRPTQTSGGPSESPMAASSLGRSSSRRPSGTPLWGALEDSIGVFQPRSRPASGSMRPLESMSMRLGSDALAAEALPPASGVLQVALEHARYPPAEAQLRAHLKQRHDGRRCHGAVERYHSTANTHNSATEGSLVDSVDGSPRRRRLVGPAPIADGTAGPEAVTAHVPFAVARGAGAGALSEGDELFARADPEALIAHSAVTYCRREDLRRSVNERLMAMEGTVLAGPLHSATSHRTASRQGNDSGRGAAGDGGQELREALERSSALRSVFMNESDSDDDALRDTDVQNATDLIQGIRRPLRRGLGGQKGPKEGIVELCDTLECCVVAFCQYLHKSSRLGGAAHDTYEGPPRDVVLLRSIAVHALSHAQPFLAEVRAAVQQAQSGDPAALQPPSGAFDGAHDYASPALRALLQERQLELNFRLLRSWSKAAETLLSIDLRHHRTADTDHTAHTGDGTASSASGGLASLSPAAPALPRMFTVQLEDHMRRAAAYYCGLHRACQRRRQELLLRWRDNKRAYESAMTRGTLPNPLQPETPAGISAEAAKTRRQVHHLIEYFADAQRQLSSEDLSQLNYNTANIIFKQQQLAGLFMEKVVPLLRQSDSFTGGLGGLGDGSDASSSGGARLAPSDAFRRVLLRYVNLEHTGDPAAVEYVDEHAPSRLQERLAKGRGRAPSPTHGHQASALAGADTEVATAKFLSMFRSSWGQATLDPNVPEPEARVRATILEDALVIGVIDAYFRLLSGPLQEKFRRLVNEEKRRAEEAETRVAEAFAAVNGSTTSPSSGGDTATEGIEALQHVQRLQLLEQYNGRDKEKMREFSDRAATRKAAADALRNRHALRDHGALALGRGDDDGEISPTRARGLAAGRDPTRLKELQALLTSTDAWFGYEKGRNDAHHQALIGAGFSDLVKSSSKVQAAKISGGGPDEGGPQGASVIKSRGEIFRLRKLQELEGSWAALQVHYAQRLQLHDKWNAAKKDLKALERAVLLYGEAVKAVLSREAVVQAILKNEKRLAGLTKGAPPEVKGAFISKAFAPPPRGGKRSSSVDSSKMSGTAGSDTKNTAEGPSSPTESALRAQSPASPTSAPSTEVYNSTVETLRLIASIPSTGNPRRDCELSRHRLLSELTTCSQRCDVAARRLLNETGDELLFKGAQYLVKMKEDYNLLKGALRDEQRKRI